MALANLRLSLSSVKSLVKGDSTDIDTNQNWSVLSVNDATQQPFVLDFQNIFEYDFLFIVNGYVMLPLTIIVLILNVTLIYIFHRLKLNNTTHIIVATICVSDVLSVLLSAIVYFVIFVMVEVRRYLPYDYCAVFRLFGETLPYIFRCFSILLTVDLATMRCLSVTHPLKFARWFTRKRTVIIILALLLFSALSRVYSLYLIYWERFEVTLFPGNTTVSTCAVNVREWARDKMWLAYVPYTIAWTVLLEIVPCIWLIVVGVIMISTLRMASKWRNKMSTQVVTRMKPRMTQEKKLTIVACWIVASFLLTEIPNSVCNSLTVLSILLGVDAGSTTENIILAGTITNICIVITLPSNFIIYCLCYRNCRRYLVNMFSYLPCFRRYVVSDKHTNEHSTVTLSSPESQRSSLTNFSDVIVDDGRY